MSFWFSEMCEKATEAWGDSARCGALKKLTTSQLLFMFAEAHLLHPSGLLTLLHPLLFLECTKTLFSASSSHSCHPVNPLVCVPAPDYKSPACFLLA